MKLNYASVFESDDYAGTFSVVIRLRRFYAHIHMPLNKLYNFLSYFLYIDSYFNTTTAMGLATEFSLSAN